MRTTLPHRTPRPRRAVLAVVATASLLVAACGDDDDQTTSPTTEAEPSTTTTAAETTTTTEAPSDEDLVRDLVLGYGTYLERLGNPNDPGNPLLGEMFTDPALARIVDIVNRNAAEGSYYEGAYEMAITGVSLDGDEGVVRTCAHDLITKRAADGSVLLPPEDAPYELDFEVRRTDAGWRIAETIPFEEEPCTLD